MTDSQALEALRSGDERGMDALMAAHQAKALRLAYQITRDREAAEDVVADAFVVVFKEIKFHRAIGPEVLARSFRFQALGLLDPVEYFEARMSRRSESLSMLRHAPNRTGQ